MTKECPSLSLVIIIIIIIIIINFMSLLGESVFARCLSSLKDERTAASKVFPSPKVDLSKYRSNTKEYIEQIRQVRPRM